MANLLKELALHKYVHGEGVIKVGRACNSCLTAAGASSPKSDHAMATNVFVGTDADITIASAAACPHRLALSTVTAPRVCMRALIEQIAQQAHEASKCLT